MTRSMQQLRLQLTWLALALVLALVQARPQQFFFDSEIASEVAAEPTDPAAAPPPFNDPSDLSTGLNLLPISNLIAAAANAQLPAPTQFVRNAMNSGL